MAPDHDLLLNSLLSQLNSNQATVRKKSVACLGKTYFNLLASVFPHERGVDVTFRSLSFLNYFPFILVKYPIVGVFCCV